MDNFVEDILKTVDTNIKSTSNKKVKIEGNDGNTNDNKNKKKG